MTFDNLTDVDFENFCYDLLDELGIQDINWRKGTGKKSSPSDDGRDIECTYCRYDSILGKNVLEKWFVESKHHKKGVPFKELSSAISWAEAETPDRLIIVCSNFLSNKCKDALKKYESNNKPKFKIEIWERPFLERKAINYPGLLQKYKLSCHDIFVDHLNSNHLEYMKNMPYNSLSQLFTALDLLSHIDLINISELSTVFYCFNDKEMKNVSSIKIINIMKEKIKKVAATISEQFAVQSFICLILNLLMMHINVEETDKMILDSQKSFQRVFRNEARIIEEMKKLTPDVDTSFVDDFIKRFFYQSPEEIIRRVKENVDLYNCFCDNVIGYLLKNDICIDNNSKEV